MRARSVLLVVVAVALAVPLSGCQRVKSAFTPEAPVVTQEATAAASGVIVEGQIPDGFPEDLPLWPGATVKDAQPSDVSMSLVLSTTEAYDEVVPGVAVGFERAGWNAVEVSEEGSATVLEVSNDSYDGLVTVYAKPEGTTIEYLLTPVQ